jgi:hypothetical protein
LKENSGHFKKGATPWNKGLKGFNQGGRNQETRFKKGSCPRNHRAVGATRLTKDGYIEIKIEEGLRKWRLLHREVWRQHHGCYPPCGTALTFKDGNKLNTDISNLELICRSDLMERNTVHNYPEEIKAVIQLRSVLTRKINDREKHR